MMLEVLRVIDKKITSATNRSERRQLQQKKQSKKIYSRFLFFSLLTAIIIGSGLGLLYFLEQQRMNEKMASETQEILKKNQQRQAQSGFETNETITEKNNLTKVTYIPKETDSLPIDDIEGRMSTLMNQATKKYKGNQHTILIGRIGSQNYTEKLASYSVMVDTYQWQVDTATFKNIGTVEDEPTYINQKTEQAVTIQELIVEDANLLGIQQVIQQQILDNAENSTDIIDAVLNLPRINWETNMTYHPDALHVVLPKNETGVTEITLSYQQIQPFIQKELVNPTFLNEEATGLDPNQKYIVLTFDDGPMPHTTTNILDVLREKDVKATFFLLGQNAKKHPDLVKRIHEEGHEVGSHSYSHPLLTNLSKEAVEKEVKQTDRAIFEATGVIPRTFRPPYGAVNADVAAIIGKPIIQWNIDSMDWHSKQKNATIQMIDQTASEGGIVLMHDIQPSTVDALPRIIDSLREQGYQFVTAEKLMESNIRPLYQYFNRYDFRKI